MCLVFVFIIFFFKKKNFFFFFVYKTPKSSASTLPCLFATLTEKYSECHLKSCETKTDQIWRKASGLVAKERIKPFFKYFPELSLLSNSLDDYSICERHYNQIIANNSFLEKLKENNNSISSSLDEGQ